MQVEFKQPGVKLLADLPLDPAGGMEEGGPGEDPDYSLKQGGRDDGESEPGRGVGGYGGLPDTVDGELEQPGDRQGKGIGAGQEQGAEKIAAAVFQQVAFEKKEFANGVPLEEALLKPGKGLQLIPGFGPGSAAIRSPSLLGNNIGTAALLGKGKMGQHLVPGSFRIAVADRFIDGPVMLE